jgi:hypothetical protein
LHIVYIAACHQGDGDEVPRDLISKGSKIYKWNGSSFQEFQSLDVVPSLPIHNAAWNTCVFQCTLNFVFTYLEKKVPITFSILDNFFNTSHLTFNRTNLMGPFDLEYFQWDGEHYLVIVQVK